MRNTITTACLAVIALLVTACGSTFKVEKYSWEKHPIDARYDSGTNTAAINAIARYEHLVTPLEEIVGYCDAEYIHYRDAETPLSNFSADVIRTMAQKYTSRQVEMGLANFGGIRNDMPKGGIRVYDIYSIYPFDNTVVVATVKGSDLRKMFSHMAKKGRVEALSGVELVIDNYKLVKALVGGSELDDSRDYRVGTINFLLTGGDGIRLGNVASHVEDTGIFVRDAVVEYFKGETAAGNVIHMDKDGRVRITNCGGN